jgi:glyoxylase-like metal-dependent hydrolase (beta-lactamase superfamily II)
MRDHPNFRGGLGRRQLLTGVVGGLLGSLVLPRRGNAQQSPPAGALAEAGVTALNDRLSLVARARTNVLALQTADGLVLVDSGAPEYRDPLMSSLRALSSGPPSLASARQAGVRTVFNTHFHPDNTGANELLRQDGATIIAHENTRLWMATPVWVPAEDRYRPARPKGGHPTETFRVDGSMTVGRERIDYGYLIEAHTSGDIYVFFRDSNVLAVGDVVSPVRDPELDYFTGAWLGGRLDALNRLLALCNAETRIVPGYGPPLNRVVLQIERDEIKTIYDRAVDRIRQGDDAGDMLEAGVLKGLQRTWKDPKKFLYDVQKGLWAHHNKLNPNVV